MQESSKGVVGLGFVSWSHSQLGVSVGTELILKAVGNYFGNSEAYFNLLS